MVGEEVEEVTIFQHILIATDGSTTSQHALTQGLTLARALRARVTLLTVPQHLASVGDHHDAFAHLPKAMREEALRYLEGDAERILADGEAAARKAGVAADPRTVDAAHAHDGIIAAAHDVGADLIVMGSHGRTGVRGLLLGSVAQKVLTHSAIPVLICR